MEAVMEEASPRDEGRLNHGMLDRGRDSKEVGEVVGC